MERRRFVPIGEGLETRVVLSSASHTVKAAATGGVTNPSSTLPETISQRLQRIQNLPYFLNQLQPGRFINPDAMHQVQASLRLLITRLTPTPSASLSFFNQQVRAIAPHASISAADANALSFAFNKALSHSSADPKVLADLTQAMSVFAKTDAASINPAYLATNDYSLVLQLALGVGRALKAPSVPEVTTADRANSKNAYVSKTSTPTLVGVYEPDSVMTVLDSQGHQLGSAATLSTGQYNLKITTPLPDGTYKLTIRAIDSGYVSLPSRVFTLQIKTPNNAKASAVPTGPMAL